MALVGMFLITGVDWRTPDHHAKINVVILNSQPRYVYKIVEDRNVYEPCTKPLQEINCVA